MKIKGGFILSKVGEDFVAMPAGELSGEFTNLIILNSTGAFLWERLATENGTDEESLLQALLAEYEIDEQTAQTDISNFLKKLGSAGILDN
ncbi:MAG: PqqD family protein [Clostridiales bacterium]|jgi:hypothetical protein|nr:PqqD family protein [Clostridiales bacterium]HOA84802.1 PqqD family protein [Bacillota bacterium]